MLSGAAIRVAVGWLAAASAAPAQCPREMVHSPMLWLRAHFGASVEIKEDVAVVGDRGDHTFCPTVACGSGAVHVYRRLDGAWELETTLFHSRISELDGFGRAISLDGAGRFAATAMGEDAAGYAAGAAYIFEHDGERWREAAEILPPIFPGHNGFGSSVELCGDTLLVGGPGYVVEGIGAAGAVYVFREEDGRWEFKQLIVAPDPRLSARFGNALALDGEWLVVGARADDEGGNLAGAAYIYRRSGDGTYDFDRKLLAPGDPLEQVFGDDVAIDGQTMAIGAANGPREWRGAVYMYEYRDEQWLHTAMLQHHDPVERDAFGAVALHGDMVVAGAFLQVIPGRSSGAAYAFQRRPDGSWRQAAKMLPETGGGYFGWGIDTDGVSVIVGAPSETIGAAVGTGAAHIFDLPCLLCRADLDGDGQLTFLDFLAFQNLFAAGDMTTDFDGDGALTFFDFLAFQNEFAAGCA